MDATILEFAVRGSGLLVAALLVVLLLRRGPARVRGTVLLVALLGLILLPAATWLLPRWRAPVLPAPEPESAEVESMDVGTPPAAPVAPDPVPFPAPAPVPVPAPAPTPVTAPPPAPPAPSSGPAAAAPGVDGVLLGWLAGVLLVLLPWIAGLVRTTAWARSTRRLDRADVPLPDGVAVGVHPSVRSPLTVGLLRSTILMPEEAASWSGETLRAALLHEAAHARRRDVLATGLARVACALHWFNPLAWIAAARMRHDGELACDEAVLADGMAPTAFAETLVRLARSARSVRLHGAAAGWGRSGLERRVDAALRARRVEPRRLPRTAAALALALAFVAAATLHPTAATHADETAVVLTVGPEDCDHATIQAALDAAPEGARIAIEEGTYEETLVVGKPVTLQGAGWTNTRLTSKFRPTGDAKKRPVPTVRIRGTKGVVLRGLRISLEGREEEGLRLRGAAVDIEASEVRMEACAVIPSPASGIDISGDADVVIRRCLVAAIGSQGIQIGGRGAGMPKVRILDSDVRYGHGRCISIGASCNDVVIEGCRISGSGWHGIRYDNASPTIRRNRITDNVRSAIYASGRTRATIEGNLFADTGMGGVGCWHQCGDLITRNTFAHNAREGLAILGASSPIVTKNVFYRNPIGVDWSGIAVNRGVSEPAEGLGTVRGNVFWENEVDLSRDESSSDASNPRIDPLLDVHYVLDANSPARALGVGATDLPPRESPFPVQPEEAEAERRYQRHLDKYGAWKGKRPREPSRRESAWQRSGAASEKSRSWLDRVRSLEDAEDREAALAEIYDAFDSQDATLRLAAFRAAAWLGTAEYDRDAWRARILPHARSDDAQERWAARYALVRVKPDRAVDLPMWVEEAQTAGLDHAEQTAESIVELVDGVLEGQAADAILHLLRDGTDIRKAFVIRGLQDVKTFDPRVMERMIEVVRSAPGHSYDSSYWFHFIAPNLDPKSDAVVDLILFRAGEGQSSLATTLRGLRKGLSDAQKRRAADRLLTFLENATSRTDRRALLQALSWVADADQRKKAAAPARERPSEPSKAQAAFLARKKTQKWLETVHSSTDGAARLTALANLRAAIDSDDEALRRAALWSSAWLGDVQFDRDDFRAAILPHTESEDTGTRQAALLALVRIKPDPAADLPLWLAEAKTVDRSFAELTAESLVALNHGVLEGEVADAILHLLRDGTDIKRAVVIRGIQKARPIDPRILVRMIEIVRSVPAHDYDSVYFFHFIAPNLDPKSDAVVDVILWRLAEGAYALDTVAKSLQTGLSAAQKTRVADRLLEVLAEAEAERARLPLYDALLWTANGSHLERLEALSERTDLTKGERERLERVLERGRKDRLFAPVRIYQSYTIEDFANPRRSIKARDILEIMADAKAPLDLRQEALDTLLGKMARSFDPDLQRTRGRVKPRNDFCRRYVTKLLKDRSEITRRFAHLLLIDYFPAYKNDRAVLQYDSQNGDRRQWKEAETHWNRVLPR